MEWGYPSLLTLNQENMNLANTIQDFLSTNPTEEQAETFYINHVLPYDKRSMAEILKEDATSFGKTEKRLTDLIGYLDEEQMNLLIDLINTFVTPCLSKSDIQRLAKMEGSIDSALPNDYVSRIKEIHPNFNTFYHVYDYRNETYGEMTNVAEELVNRIYKVLSKNY